MYEDVHNRWLHENNCFGILFVRYYRMFSQNIYWLWNVVVTCTRGIVSTPSSIGSTSSLGGSSQKKSRITCEALCVWKHCQIARWWPIKWHTQESTVNRLKRRTTNVRSLMFLIGLQVFGMYLYNIGRHKYSLFLSPMQEVSSPLQVLFAWHCLITDPIRIKPLSQLKVNLFG